MDTQWLAFFLVKATVLLVAGLLAAAALRRAAAGARHVVWLATLTGVAFLSHQIGSSLGVWLGGFAFDRTGSYAVIWWLSILFGVLSAVINLPIVERPAPQVVPATA